MDSYIDRFDNVRWYDEDGHVHREDGPARMDHDGSFLWCLNGHAYGFHQWLKNTPITDEQKLLLRLQYG